MRRIPGVESAGFGLSLPYERGLNDQIDIADGAQAGRHHTITLIYVARLIRSQVYGAASYDWKMFIGVILVIAGVALASILIPTLRISRIDPAETLRAE